MRRIRDLLEELVATGGGAGELALGELQLPLDLLEAIELLRRRLAVDLLLGAKVVDARDVRAPFLVGVQEVERLLERALALGPVEERTRLVPERSDVDHRRESRKASTTWATPSSSTLGQTRSAAASTRSCAFATATA